MSVIESRVEPSSPEFRENLAHMDGLESDLRQRLATARAGGGEEAVKRQRELGKLLARERIERVPAAVDFTDEALVVRLTDGRSLSVPLAWLPRLKHASDEDRRSYQLIDGGEEIRWPSLDEDLSVRGLLGLPD